MRSSVPKFIQRAYDLELSGGMFHAIVLMVDIHSFSRISELFALNEEDEGNAALSSFLNDFFRPLVQAVYSNNGFITNFTGDGFTALFPTRSEQDIPISSALDSSLMIESEFEVLQKRLKALSTNSNIELELGLGLALASGFIEWGIVHLLKDRFQELGSEVCEAAYYFRGRGIEKCAELLRKSRNGKIIIDDRNPSVDLDNLAEGWMSFELLNLLLSESSLSESVAYKAFLSVRESTLTEGEYKEIVSVFISIAGVDASSSLDLLCKKVLSLLAAHHGSLNNLEFGDKGGVFFCLFGAPYAIENSMKQALTFSMALQKAVMYEAEFNDISIKVGVNKGRAYAGYIGGLQRSYYTVIGQSVNLAARLMTAAGENEVWLTKDVFTGGFEFTDVGLKKYKNILVPVSTYRCEGLKESNDRFFSLRSPFIGRAEVLDTLESAFSKMISSSSVEVFYLYGEGGIGKSRTAYEWMQTYKGSRYWIHAPQNSSGVQSFAILKDFVLDLVGMKRQNWNESVFSTKWKSFQQKLQRDILKRSDERLLSAFEQALDAFQQVIPHLMRILSVDNFTLKDDATYLYNRVALFNILNSLIKLLCIHQPLIIEIEDLSAMRKESAWVLEQLIHSVQRLPILLLCTSRYGEKGDMPVLPAPIHQKLSHSSLELSTLPEEAVLLLAKAHLGEKVHSDVTDKIYKLSKGNPFFAEQLIFFLLESEADLIGGDALEQLDKLPSDITALLGSRIDRLPAHIVKLVKLTAIIGEVFDIGFLGHYLQKPDIKETLEEGVRSRIWRISEEMCYFRQSLLRQVAYDRQLNYYKTVTHEEIAKSMAQYYGEKSPAHFAEVAHHYELGKQWNESMMFWLKAGQHAFTDYQSSSTITYFDNAIRLANTKDGDRLAEQVKLKALIGKGQAHELNFNIEEALALYLRAEAYLREKSIGLSSLIAQLHTLIGYARLQLFSYEKALDRFNIVLREKNRIDVRAEYINATIGIAKTHRNRGHYKLAEQHYNSALALLEHLTFGEKTNLLIKILGGLGDIQFYYENYTKALEHYKEKWKLCNDINDRHGLSQAYNTIGNVLFAKGEFLKAIKNYKDSIALCLIINDKKGGIIAKGNIGISHKNIGNFDKAEELFLEQLEEVKSQGTKYVRNTHFSALINLANLYLEKGDTEQAMHYAEKRMLLLQKAENPIAKINNYMLIGRIHAGALAYEEAIEAYQTAIGECELIEHAGYAYKLYLLIAQAYYSMEDYEQSWYNLQLFYELTPIPIFGEILKGRLLYHRGQTEEALNCIQQLSEHPSVQEHLYRVADVQFALWEITKEPEARVLCHQMYKALHAEIPSAFYKQRIAACEGEALI